MPPSAGEPSHHRNRGHRAKRSLGQNFLVDPNLQRKIVDALEPSSEDEVLEIGPGQGALTRHLEPRVRRLILVELDDGLAEALRQAYQDSDHVHVVHGDFLDLTLDKLSADPAMLKVIGNIPYNITTPIIFALLERRPRPRQIVLMVQREVADRIVAPPGSRTYGALAVGVQAVARAERVLHVSRSAFRPVPDVESTVIRITPDHPPRLSPDREASLRTLTRTAFGKRRKQFQRILRDGYALEPTDIQEIQAATGFDLNARPESFSPDEFVTLAELLTTRTAE